MSKLLEEIDAPQEEEPEEGRRMDPELRAISLILRTLKGLGEPGAARVVAYVSARYGSEQCRS